MTHDPERVLNQAEQVDTPDGPLRIVNKVCTVTARPLVAGERALDVDEESEYCNDAEGAPALGRPRRDLDYGDSTDDETAPALPAAAAAPPARATGKAKKKLPLPSLLSLRFVQRRWLPLGYKKNKVGTALGIRYAPPLMSTHMAFSADRLLSMGADNRANDRAGMIHATLPYLFRPLSDLTLKPRRFGVLRRVSQNIVASQRMPRGQKLCMLLFQARLSDEVSKKPPRLFKSIVIKHEPRRTTFLFYRDKKICVGASSFADMAAAYDYFQPIVNDCLNTPENEAAELELIRRGAADENVARVLLNFVVGEGGRITPVYKGDKPARKKGRK